MGDNIIKQFLTLTGLESEESAQEWLFLGNFDLETSVNLYFTSDTKTYPQPQHALKSRKTDEYDEDGIRKPMETKRMRLIDPILKGIRFTILTLQNN